MELWSNGGGTAAPAQNRHFPPNFLPFLAKFKYKERQESGRLIMQEKRSVVLLEVCCRSIYFLKVSSANRREIFILKKSFSQMIENCLIWRESTNKIGGKRRFSAGAAIPPPFIHSSKLYFFKRTAMQNLRAVTLYLIEFLLLLVLVSKSVTSAPSL